MQTGGDDVDDDPIDVHYRKIKTDMEVVDKSGEEFAMIEVCLEDFLAKISLFKMICTK